MKITLEIDTANFEKPNEVMAGSLYELARTVMFLDPKNGYSGNIKSFDNKIGQWTVAPAK